MLSLNPKFPGHPVLCFNLFARVRHSMLNTVQNCSGGACFFLSFSQNAFCFCWALVLASPSVSLSPFLPIIRNKNSAAGMHTDAGKALAAALTAGSSIGSAIFCKRPMFASLPADKQDPEGYEQIRARSTNTSLLVRMALYSRLTHHEATLCNSLPACLWNSL